MGSSPISGIKGEIYSKKSAFWKEGFFCFKEFVQLQLNYLDWDSEGVQSRKCYETAVKHGKPVIVMEPVKGGTLARVPESVEKYSGNATRRCPSRPGRFVSQPVRIM